MKRHVVLHLTAITLLFTVSACSLHYKSHFVSNKNKKTKVAATSENICNGSASKPGEDFPENAIDQTTDAADAETESYISFSKLAARIDSSKDEPSRQVQIHKSHESVSANSDTDSTSKAISKKQISTAATLIIVGAAIGTIGLVPILTLDLTWKMFAFWAFPLTIGMGLFLAGIILFVLFSIFWMIKYLVAKKDARRNRRALQK